MSEQMNDSVITCPVSRQRCDNPSCSYDVGSEVMVCSTMGKMDVERKMESQRKMDVAFKEEAIEQAIEEQVIEEQEIAAQIEQQEDAAIELAIEEDEIEAQIERHEKLDDPRAQRLAEAFDSKDIDEVKEALESESVYMFNEMMTRANPPGLSLEEAQAVVATKTLPRVTKEYIEGRIKQVRYILDGTGTFCVIEMINSFETNGFSKPADPGNYDQEVGQRYAYEDAFKKLWALEGYLLCEQLKAARRA